MAGRKSQINLNDQLLVYECYKEQLFKDRQLVPLSNPIYEIISSELEKKFNVSFSRKAVYLSIKRNSQKINGESDMKNVVNSSDSDELDLSSERSDCSTKEPYEIYEIKNEDSFDFLKPLEKDIGIKTCRTKKVLNPGWADELARVIFSETKMECNLSFLSRGYFQSDFVSKGVCKECDARMEIRTENNFCKLIIKVFHGKMNVVHESKRRLKGKYKNAVLNDLKTNKPIKVYELMCSSEITTEGIEPAHLPSQNAIKQQSYRSNLKNNVANNSLNGFIKLSKDVFYGPCIVKLGIINFYVFYWTPLQIEWYRQYAKMEKAVISIDATGRVVSPLSDDLSNKHVFLYTIMAKPLNGKSVPICQMLSQDQSSTFISYWLNLFKSQFLKIPVEVVVDDSSALAKSIITTFSNCASTNHYINMCVAFLEENSKLLPEFYFRLDRSHISKNIMRSKILPNRDTRFKIFFKRVFGCLILCRSWTQVKKIVYDMFTVVLNPFNGTADFPAELSQENLRKLIKTHDFDDIICEGECDDDHELEDDNDDEGSINFVNVDKKWIMEIVDSIEIIEATSENESSRRDNAYFYPPAKEYFVGLLTNIVTWGNVMMDPFKSTIVSPTSSNSESYFNTVKHAYKQKVGLERPDNFVKAHLDCIDGGIKKAMSNLRKSKMATLSKVEDLEDLCLELSMNEVNLEETDIVKDELHEDWGGLNNKNVSRNPKQGAGYDPGEGSSRQSNPSRRAKSSILNPQPDFNDNAKNIKVQLFQNGHINRRLKNPVYAMNTCAFDAVIHIFIAIFRDSAKVEKLVIDTQKKFIFSHFLKLFSVEGVTERLYKFRTEILEMIGGDVKKGDNQLTIVEGNCNLEFIFNKLIFGIFPTTLTTVCTKCTEVTTRNFGYMPCDGKQIYEEGISSLSSIICAKLEEIYAQTNCNTCDGYKYPKLNISKLIFIDMEYNSFNKVNEKKYSIEDLPKRLIIKSMFFKLKGILEHIPSTNTDSSGHYRSHCFRDSCLWEVYDDLKKIPAKSNVEAKMSVHTIIYIMDYEE